VNAAYDAACFRIIFGRTHPEVDFISVGNSSDTARDRLGVGHAIQTLSTGTTVTRVVDRDFKSAEEVAALEAEGTRVLGRRHIEAYLFDDEVVEALCRSVGKVDKVHEAKGLRAAAIAASVARGNDADDIKRAAGEISNGLRRLLALEGAGSTAEAFARDTMAKLLVPEMHTYKELERSVFGAGVGSSSATA
jgi:hypothetical protein